LLDWGFETKEEINIKYMLHGICQVLLYVRDNSVQL